MQKHTFEGWAGAGLFAFALSGCGSAPALEEQATETWGETSEALAFVPSGRDCSTTEMTEILRPPNGPGEAAVRVACSFTYPDNPESFMPDNVDYPGKITRRLEFAGADAVGLEFMCRNAHIHPAFLTDDGRAITIRSEYVGSGDVHDPRNWTIPNHIKIANCYIEGNVRITGFDGSLDCDSSCSSDPERVLIKRRQDTAPHHVNLFWVDVTTLSGRTGATEFTSTKASPIRPLLAR